MEHPHWLYIYFSWFGYWALSIGSDRTSPPPPQSPTPVFGYNPTASTIHTPKIPKLTPLRL
ncbi:hypothetical protein H6G96_37245 [Nostoc sp. FACHB-892]|uniref:hypothetical protein n=1 Tax=Nostoc sp. FACHB-892 TaxID=2692843 RepID=UPI001687009C|nr:hypothetical protein [Nostoc sp. FACHB-892]MBD2731772.1 hypothetical protein [Nostoc sp. FACHB-892]